MRLYDVEGHDAPLMLSEDHAKRIGATEHVVDATKPSSRASKQAWIDYAIAQGADPALVETMTRSEIVDNFG